MYRLGTLWDSLLIPQPQSPENTDYNSAIPDTDASPKSKHIRGTIGLVTFRYVKLRLGSPFISTPVGGLPLRVVAVQMGP